MTGYGYGVVSIGHPALHLTVGAGLPVIATGGSPATGPPLLLAAGAIGLGRHVVIATENWFFPSRPQLRMVNAGILRLLVWRLSLGLGAARVGPLRLPPPWSTSACASRGEGPAEGAQSLRQRATYRDVQRQRACQPR